ncbi:uncharacterized protein LOC123678268 isoform X2 [Harmonia axyridis]|uniref:uncharacterized protein LOC123678268 isoform X2 n=1 Tax=Harmonia axyridis TaxID=115357 RepID=UPI001E27503F|nr:uncharacterized protein LOC123678268 isoform X2 [Harmonia axyridis]
MSSGNIKTNVYFFLVIGTFAFVACVKINKLQVPEVIQHGNAAVLDCDFTLEETDEDLVVKWFFNKNNRTLVYQWIPASKSRPQVLGILKDRLNLEYAASVDANSIHRALHILQAGPDLSGEYTCSVSTLQSEDIRTKSMLVFERSLILRRLSSDEGSLRVQCIAEGVFPTPIISLYSQDRELTEAQVTSRQRGQLYDISATATLEALKEPEEFSCDLRIPEANYTVRRETVIYPGNEGPPIRSGKMMIISACILIICKSLPFREIIKGTW